MLRFKGRTEPREEDCPLCLVYLHQSVGAPAQDGWVFTLVPWRREPALHSVFWKSLKADGQQRSDWCYLGRLWKGFPKLDEKIFVKYQMSSPSSYPYRWVPRFVKQLLSSCISLVTLSGIPETTLPLGVICHVLSGKVSELSYKANVSAPSSLILCYVLKTCLV